MQLFANTNINFMKWKTHFVVVSTILNLFGLGIFASQYFTNKLNVGIDFKGGTEIQVKFAKPVSVSDVRQGLDNVELRGAVVTTIGDPSDNEIYIRLPLQPGETQVMLEKVKDALRTISGANQSAQAGVIDLNVADEKAIADHLVAEGHFSPDEAKTAATAIAERKKVQGGILRSTDEIKTFTGVNPETLSWLSQHATVSPFSIRSQNSVEGAVSKELAQRHQQ